MAKQLNKMVVAMSFIAMVIAKVASSPDYGEALSKSIIFFEGQRSGKLPLNQRLTWRKNSALTDGFDNDVDLVGGYYDAGDNIKFNFPMAFSTTLLAWSVLEFGNSMDTDLKHALEAIRWATDYFLKATNTPGIVYAQVGDPNADHNCWERPEDMDTPRTVYAVTKHSPGSEVSAEIAAALAASSMVFKHHDFKYSKLLLRSARRVFKFADKYRGSYNISIGSGACPFYCDFNGYQDELVWGAAWLHKATHSRSYWNYVTHNIFNLENTSNGEDNLVEFGWDAKHAGINILVSKHVLESSLNYSPFIMWADKFACSLFPESSFRSVNYSSGGLLFKPGLVNMQHATSLSFLLVVYARYLANSNRMLQCENFVASPSRLIQIAKGQVDYILGNNPMNISYMVGYGEKFPQRIHHRGSSLPSVDQHQSHIECKGGTPFFESKSSNPNVLVGAVVGGPDIDDNFYDDRMDAFHSEPTTYVNAPLVGLLAYFNINNP